VELDELHGRVCKSPRKKGRASAAPRHEGARRDHLGRNAQEAAAMSYRLIVKPSAERDVERLPQPVERGLLDRLAGIGLPQLGDDLFRAMSCPLHLAPPCSVPGQ
jgi:hypothetical protein